MPQPRVWLWLNYFFSPLVLSNKRQLDKDKKKNEKKKNKRRKEMQRERGRGRALGSLHCGW
jgi:hypothetical protein